MENGWKEVHYGRRRQCNHQPGWDRVKEASRGKDRVPPVLFPAQAQFPNPNLRRPAPCLCPSTQTMVSLVNIGRDSE